MGAAVTTAAEGFPRRAFTVAEVLAMQAAGVFGEDENFELVEGEIVPMAPKHHAHEIVKAWLNLRLARALPNDLWLGIESSMYLSDRTCLEPDLVVYARGRRLEAVRGPDIILAIEVAATTMAYDRGLKAQLYARYGVQELWVVDANRRRTHVHRGPSADGWAEVVLVETGDALVHPALPGFTARLAEADE